MGVILEKIMKSLVSQCTLNSSVIVIPQLMIPFGLLMSTVIYIMLEILEP